MGEAGMRAGARDALVMWLAAAAGALDSWSYFGLGHVFVANMTGNTVMFGFAATMGDWAHARLSAFVIGAYVVGVFAGSLLAGPIRKAAQAGAEKDKGKGAKEVLWPGRTTTILVIEWLLVAGAAVAAYRGRHGAEVVHWGLLGAAGAAVGLQSAAMNALKLPGIVTTYITGTWTTLVAGVGRLMEDKKERRETTEWEGRLGMQASVLLTYCASAAGAGAMFRWRGGSLMGLLPAVILLLVILGSWVARRGGAEA